MNLPSLIFSFVLSTLYGAAFHAWRGGGPGRLLLTMLLAWAGFAFGQWAAGAIGWTFDLLGAVHIFTASIVSILTIIIGRWLSFRPDKPA